VKAVIETKSRFKEPVKRRKKWLFRKKKNPKAEETPEEGLLLSIKNCRELN
jgi:hypothetical protein